MISKVFIGWHFLRVLRLAMGILIIIQSVFSKEWMYSAMGGLLTLMPLLNVELCSASSCSVSNKKRKLLSN